MVAMTDKEEITLKEYIDALFHEREKQTNLALAAAKDAVTLAERNSEKWRENANEWRAAMSDRELNFARDSEFQDFKKAVENILAILQTKQAVVDSKASTWLVWVGLFFTGAAFFFGLISVTVSLYNAFLK